MSKYDDYVQPEEETEMLIYEEWLSYVDEVNLAREEDWEDWVNSVGWSDQGYVIPKQLRQRVVAIVSKNEHICIRH